MKCVYCNFELVAGAQFCPECGKPQPTYMTCAYCGKTVLSDAVYCENCGSYLRGPNSATPISTTPKGKKSNPLIIVLVSLIGLLLVGVTGWAVWEYVIKDQETNTTESVSNNNNEMKQHNIDSPSLSQGITPLPNRVVVTGTGVRLRYTPEINSSNIYEDKYGRGIYPRKGQSLEVVGEANDFYQVKFKGGTYYITKQYASPCYD